MLKEGISIAIIGTRGIPNNYGGFEQFAEYLSVGLVQRGCKVTVYNSHSHPFQDKTWNGVDIVHCNDPENKYGTIGQFIYDFNCILDTRRKSYDIILQLGYTSSSIWWRLLPKRKTIITTNMDGLEWKRTKFSKPTQLFLRFAEKLAIKHSDYLISDSIGIQKHISDSYGMESTYIPYGSHVFSNPSQDVIKKFLRDYEKWNFEQYVQISSTDFPDPTYEIIDEVYIIKYKVYINQQPIGLPLDHVSTLKDTFEFWEAQELKTNNQKAKMTFEITKLRHEANVWVTWVVRDMGEGVLGHAHLGKGVVEVALGDYSCDGSFQLYDVETVEQIMTHELGHSIGLMHTNDKENIMYPSMTPHYAYCLLN